MPVFFKRHVSLFTLAWAPLMPPRPEVKNTFPARESRPRYFRPAFSTVSWNGKKTGTYVDHNIQQFNPHFSAKMVMQLLKIK
jgi:hypothetical protein